MGFIQWQYARTNYVRFDHPRGKFYRGMFTVRNFSRFTLRKFKTAQSADEYAAAVMERYGRLLAVPVPFSLEDERRAEAVAGCI